MAAEAQRRSRRTAPRALPAAADAAPHPAPARAGSRLAVRRDWLLATTALLPIAAGPAMAQPAPGAGPTGGQVVAGQAGITRAPGRTTITQGTDRAAIDWQQFNVGSQHTVQFIQPNQGSWTLNRVVGPDPSVIAGRVQANGGVAIVNQSGMVFAGGAQVNVGSLIASAAGITNDNFMAGRMAFDQAARPGARVENRGTITVADRGLAALVGPGVSNSGVIRARLGRVALGAAETFVLDLAGDGLIGIDVTQAVRTAPEGGQALVTNAGVIEAPGGSVLITAHAASGLVEDLVRQTGRIEAPTLGARTGEVALRAEGGGVRVDGRVAATGGAGERGGRIAVQGSGTVAVGAAARIDASGGAGGGQVLVGTTGRGRDQRMAARTMVERGAEIRADATVAGDGGMLVLNSLERTEMRGALSARGGPGGGNGGFVELSGQAVIEAAGTVDVRAPAGANGELLLDPQNIIVSDTALPGTPAGLPGGESVTVEITTATGAVTANDAGPGEDTRWTRVATAAITGFAGTVTLDATRDIIVDSAISKANGGLTLLAGRNLTLGAAVTVSGDFVARAGTGAIAVNAAVTAGTAPAPATLTLRADTITFSGGGSLAAPSGTIEIGTQTATRDLQVGGSAGGRLLLPAAPLNAAAAGTLRLGRTTVAGEGTVTADDVTIATGAPLARPAGGALEVIAGGDLTVDAGLTANAMRLAAVAGTLDIGANLRATALTLEAGTAIDQTGGNIQFRAAPGTALPITAVAGGGAVSLDNANNGNFALGPSSATAGFTVAADAIATTGAIGGTAVSLTADTGALTIGADIRATSLALTGAGGINQTGGSIQHATGAATQLPLTANASGAGSDVALGDPAAGNGNLALGGSTASGTFTVVADTLSTTGTVSGSAVSLTADTGLLTLGGDLRATSLSLAGAAGIAQASGTIRHRTNAATLLTVSASSAGGDVALDDPGNGNLSLGFGGASGGFTVAAATLATAGAITAGAVALTADTGGLTIGADIRATSLTLAGEAGVTQSGGTIAHATAGTELPVAVASANGAVALTLAGNGVFDLQASSAGAAFEVAAATLRASGPVSGTEVTLTARTGTLALEADIRADTRVTLAGGTGISQSGGTIENRSGAADPLDVAAAVSGTGGVALTRANGALVLLAGGTADGAFAVTSAAGLAIEAANLVAVNGAASLTVQGAGNGMTLLGELRASSVALVAEGPITQTFAGTTGVLMARGAGGAAAPGTALPLSVAATGTGNGIDLAGENGRLRVTSAITADGSILIRARNLDIAGPVTAEATGAGQSAATLTAFNLAGTGSIAIGSAAAITAASLTLNATRAITQEAGAAITLAGGTGRLTVRGATGGGTSAGSIGLTAGTNQIGELDARAAAVGALSGAVDVTAQGALSVIRAAGTTVTLDAATLTVAAGGAGVVADGAVRLSAGALGIDAPVQAGPGATLTLRADSLAFAGGSLAAAGGTIEIGPQTALRPIELAAGINPAALRIAAADLEAASAATLRLGRTTLPGSGTVTAGAVTVDQALTLGSGTALELVGSGAITVGQPVSAGGLRLDAGGAIALGAVEVAATAGGIRLHAAGGISQAAGGALVAATGLRDLVAQAGSGGIALAGLGDFRLADGGVPPGLTEARSLYATGSIAFSTTGTITVAAAAEAAAPGTLLSLTGASIAIQAPLITPDAAVSLTATGAGGTIAQTAAGGIRAGTLTLGADGAIALGAAANAVGALGTVSFETGFALRTQGGLTIGAALAPGGGNADIALRADAGTLQINAPVGAGAGTVTLEATAGAIQQAAAGAAITAGRLEVTAGTNALLAPATDANAVAVLGPSTVGGTLALATTGALTLEGSIAQSAPGGTVRVAAGGALTLDAGAALGFGSITLTTPGAMTLSGTVGLSGQPDPASAVRLRAGGDITQGGGGNILADSLGLRAGGAATLTAAANDVRQVAADATGAFALATTGALATTTVAGVPLADGTLAAVGGVAGSSVSLSADGLTIGAEALRAAATNGVVQLRADRLTVLGQVFAGSPSGIPTFNGLIDIAPRALARPVSLGADGGSGSLFISDAALLRLVSRNIVIGHDAPGAGTLTVGAPASVLDGVNSITLRGGAVALDSSFDLVTPGGLLALRASTGDIAQGAAGGVTADRLSATADAGSVLLGAPGTGTNTVLQVSGGVAAGATFVFEGAGSYAVAAPGIAAAGATVALSGGGDITQGTGARITADRLSVTAPGAVALDGGGSLLPADLNSIGTLAPSAGASLTLRNARDLTVEGASANAATGGIVLLEAPGLTLDGNLTANNPSGRVVLRTGSAFDAPATGDITQTGGVIRAQGLSASAGGDIVLDAPNEVTRLIFGVSQSGQVAMNGVVTAPGGTFLIANSLGSLTVDAPINAGTGGAIGVLSNGLGVTFAGTAFLAPGGLVQFAPFTAGGTIGLGGPGGLDTTTISVGAIQQVQTGRLVIGALEPFDQVSSGTITLRGALDLTVAGAPTTLELRSGGSIAADGFALSVAQISAIATGTIAIGTPDSRIGRVVDALPAGTQGLQAGGTSVRLVTGGDLATGLFTLAAPIRTAAGGSITLQAPDFVLLPGAVIDTGPGAPGRIELRSGATLGLGGATGGAGTARLTEAELAQLDAHGGTFAAVAPDIRLWTWSIDPADATRLSLALTTGGGGSIAQVAGPLSVAALDVAALAGAGTVQMTQAGNALPVVGVQAQGNVSIATDGALEIRRTTNSGGATTYRGTEITLGTAGLGAGQVTIDAPGRDVTLVATAGDVTGTAPAAAVRAASLAATATQGEVRLTGDNALGTFAATARDGVTFRGQGATTAGAVGAGGAGTAVAGTIDIAAGALTLTDVLGEGTVLLEATTGALVQAAGARLAAGTLSAEAFGSLRLDGANPDGSARNAIQDLTLLQAGGDITLRNALALTLDLPVTVGIDRILTLEAAGLTLANTLAAAGANGQIILRTGGFQGGIGSGGDIVQTGGAISAARLAALGGGTVTLDRAGNAIGALGGGRDADGVALGLGLAAGGGATLRSAGFAGSATLGVTDAVRLGAGGALTLRADDFAIGADLRAPGGVITLLPVTAGAGIGYVLGGAPGSATAGRITLDGTELGFLPSGAAAAELRLGQIGVTGSVSIAGTVNLMEGGAPRVGRLALAGDGALTQASGMLLDVAALSANFPTGVVRLDPGVAGNRIGALDGVTAGGDVAVRGGAGPMALRAGPGGSAIEVPAGAGITLRADDLGIQAALRAPGGIIRILPETAGRGVTLGGPDAAAGTLALGTAEIARIGAGAAPALRLVIGADGALRTAGDILVAGDVPLRAGATVRVGTLELVAGTPGTPGGSVRQSAGSVDVATLTGTAQGDFQLGLAGNAFGAATGIAAGTLPAAGATGRVELGAAGTLTASAITAPVSVGVRAGGTLTAGGVTAPVVLLEGDGVTLAGVIQGSTSVAINSAGGVTQQAGALVIAGLFTLNGGAIALPEANEFIELGGLVATGPVLALNTVLPVLVSGPVTAVGSLSLATDQGLTIGAGGGITVTGGAGAATLTAGGAIDYAGTLATSGAASLTSGGVLAFTGSATVGGGLTLGAGTAMTLGGTLGTGGAFAATAGGALGTSAQITAAGAATLAAGTTLTAGGRIEATGAGIAMTGGTGLAADGTFVAGGALSLTATTGGLTLAGTASAGGAATLDAPRGPVSLAGSLIAGGPATVTAGGALSSTGAVQAGTALALTAGGAITLAGTHVAGTTLALTAGTGLSMAGTVQAGGAVTLTAGGALALAGQTTAGTDLDVSAGGVATLTAGKITAGRAVRLSAGQGLVAQGFQIDPATILLQTGGAMSLTDSTLVSGESIRLGAGTITLRRTNVSTGTLDADAAGSMLLDGGAFTIGRAVAFSAPGGIQTTGRIFVMPRGGVLPAVVFDTRAGGITPEPLSIVEPDQPGLPARQQATQVRVPGTEAPGDFGPASGAPAGTMVIDIDAGRSPVFLLLDGGTATGTIASAGRLGIHGTGGSAELVGRLTDVSGTPVDGAAAARFADSTRPAASGALTRYRLNGCVVSSVNCIVPSQIITIPQAPPQQVDLRLGNNRITDPEVQVPNVADEDY